MTSEGAICTGSTAPSRWPKFPPPDLTACHIRLRGNPDGLAPAQLTPGFSAGLTGKGPPPAWKIVEDPTAPAGSRVVAETSGDRTDSRFPQLILDGLEAKAVPVTVAFKPVSGRVDQAAGIAVRMKDSDNDDVARANALEGNVRLYKVVGGKRIQFAGTDVRIPAGQWQTLGLGVQGDRLGWRCG
jgi:hypothetical protein